MLFLQYILPSVDGSMMLKEPCYRTGEEHRRRKGLPKIITAAKQLMGSASSC